MAIKFVSFDIYDTLIKRILPVQKLHEIMQERLNSTQEMIISDFVYKRKSAENDLKKQGVEYSLGDIYNSSFFSEYNQIQKDYLISMEEELEINNTVPAYYGNGLYKQFSSIYEILCISDMYLSQDVLKKILIRNGYSIPRIYVSCEYRKSKRNRELFSVVLDDLEISGKELLHIGDAKRSDYINPKIMGIRSRLIHKVKGLIKTDDYYFDFGFNVLGPVFYEFCLWIRENVHDEKLLFVSREGELLREIYDILFQCSSEMIYISRVSLIRGTAYILLQSDGLEDFFCLISRLGLEKKMTLGKFFQRLDVRTEKYERQMRVWNLDCKSRVSSVSNGKWKVDSRFQAFLECILPDLLIDLREKNFIFDCYMNEKLDNTNILVDIGWRGSMQHILQEYVANKGMNIKFKGLYLGILDVEDSNGYEGFLFKGEKNNAAQSILNFSGLLEILMMPKYGSVTGYILDKEDLNIIPEFDESEFDEDSYRKIEAVQAGIKELIKLLAVHDRNHCFDCDTILKRLIKKGVSPGREEIDSFSLLHFYANGDCVPLIEDFKAFDVLNVKRVKKAFQDCKWKAAFFRKLFRIKLPYNVMLVWGRKFLKL